MKILYLVGPHAVGKSHFMEELALENQFFVFDTGPQMRKMHKAMAPDKSILEWVDTLETEYGPFITCELLCKVFEKEYNNYKNVIVTGFRQIEGIEYMTSYLAPEDYEILFIDGTFELLKQNYIFREKREVSDLEFREYLQEEEKWGLSRLRQYVFDNPKNCRYIKKMSNDQSIFTSIFDEPKKLLLDRDSGEKKYD